MLPQHRQRLIEFSPVFAGFSGPVPDHLGVDGTGDAVVQLGIELVQLVRRVD